MHGYKCASFNQRGLLHCALYSTQVDFFTHDIRCPGSFLRILTNPAHPLMAGVGDEAFMYFRDNMNLMNTGQHTLVGYFPDEQSDDWFVSGCLFLRLIRLRSEKLSKTDPFVWYFTDISISAHFA
eukprot:COSAG05_NODE_8_length_40675_cov_148.837539_43_plen_125_part_00